jgi:hypothetical protein
MTIRDSNSPGGIVRDKALRSCKALRAFDLPTFLKVKTTTKNPKYA